MDGNNRADPPQPQASTGKAARTATTPSNSSNSKSGTKPQQQEPKSRPPPPAAQRTPKQEPLPRWNINGNTSKPTPSGPPEKSARAKLPPAEDVEFNPTITSVASSRPGFDSLSSVKQLSHLGQDVRDDWVEINDDVYNMFFLSRICGQAFWYAIYIFILKLTLYTFLINDAVDVEMPDKTSNQVLVTQFFMLPVAVAMQDDLIATYFLVANLKYSPLIRMQNPDAKKWKFHVANFCRGVDGMYSLLVNFIILLKATEVLPLFLNFAALQFLQTIDNIALRLCVDGYLSERLEEVANNVLTTKLPNKNNKVFRSMDSILFLSTFSALLIAWAVISFG